MSQLICKNLLVGYEGKAILDPLNFEIHAGDHLCVVGENGAGKSTLMKTLLGLQQPISGQLEMGDGLRQNEIGYLPQQTIVQEPLWTAPVLQSGGKAACAGCHAQNADRTAGKTLLSGAFRRSAAARPFGARPLRYPENAASGRTCFRS